MREAKPDPDAGEHDPPALEYDRRADHVTRRQFRLLLVLTAINTILLGSVIAGPVLVTFLREQWAQQQQRRQARAAIQQRLSQIEQNLAQLNLAALPPDTVVYTEDPAEAAELIAAEDEYRSATLYGRTRLDVPVFLPTPDRWQRIVQVLPGLGNQSGATIYLHEHQDPAGNERYVWVTMEHPERVLRTRSIDLGWQAANPQTFTALFSLHLAGGPRSYPLRLSAGQPDPDDPTRFTLHYEINGRPGTIAGRVADDGEVILEPQNGRIISAEAYRVLWDPAADADERRPSRPMQPFPFH